MLAWLGIPKILGIHNGKTERYRLPLQSPTKPAPLLNPAEVYAIDRHRFRSSWRDQTGGV